MVERLDDRVKDLAVELRPPSIEEFGLTSTLESELEDITNRHDVELDYTTDSIDCLLAPEDEVHLYRVIQEAITNALRHGDPDSISVDITQMDNKISVKIRDDGSGFDTKEVMESKRSRSRLGLIGMRERVRTISGDINIESTPGSGTTIEITVPYNEGKQNGLN